MKFDVRKIRFGTHRNGERLNSAVEVHIEQRVFVVPDASTWGGYLVTNKPDPIVARIRFLLRHRCACPGHDGGLHSDRRCDRGKSKRGCAADRELTIREDVKHVALGWMRLAPRVLMRAEISGFAKIGCTRILGCVEITSLNPDPMRDPVVVVASMVVGVRWERPGEGIDPCSRTDAALVTIQSGNVRVGAASAKMCACLAITGVAGAAN